MFEVFYLKKDIMKVSQIQSNEYADYQSIYIQSVSDEFTLVEELEIALHRFIHFVQDIPMDKFDYRYAENKWTIKEIIQHIIDAERVFAYRALRFARYDTTELAGFEENSYVENSDSNSRSIMDLLNELSALRYATIALFKSFKTEQLLQIGTASGYRMSVRALGFATIGHQNHHQKVFIERYLK